MNLQNLTDKIGKHAQVVLDIEKKLIINVTIQNVRSSFGQDEYLVTPLAGSGQKWVRHILTWID